MATNTSSADDDDVVFGASLTIVQRPTPAKVALNEIAPGGSGFQVELANYGSAAVNVGGYVLRRDSGTSVSDFALPAASLGVGQYVAFTAAQLGFIPQVGDKLFLYGPGRSIELKVLPGAYSSRKAQGP